LAALAVVMQHFSATAQSYCRTTIPSLVPHGYVGVDFFFVLSGFIMAYSYAADFQARGLAAYGGFLAKRIARIVPLNVAVLAGLALAGIAGAAWTGSQLAFGTVRPFYDFTANLLMLQGLGIGTNLNGPSWSISTECAAYAVFPLLVTCVFGGRARAWSVVVAAAGAVFALAASRPHLSMAIEAFPGSLVRCFAEFVLGMAAYRLSGRRAVVAFLKRDLVAAGLACAALAFLVARLDLPAVLLLPFVVVAYATNDGVMSRLLQWRPLHGLGIVSYSLYLLHSPVRPLELALLKSVTNGPVGATAALCFAALGSLSVIPVAWLAYTAVERPGRSLVRSRLNRKEQGDTSARLRDTIDCTHVLVAPKPRFSD
jgi:peptidoglycan/LPS O-acetylase OafA/YrhL